MDKQSEGYFEIERQFSEGDIKRISWWWTRAFWKEYLKALATWPLYGGAIGCIGFMAGAWLPTYEPSLVLAFVITWLMCLIFYAGHLVSKQVSAFAYFNNARFHFDDRYVAVNFVSKNKGLYPSYIYQLDQLEMIKESDELLVLRYGDAELALPKKPLEELGKLEWFKERIKSKAEA